MSEDHSNSNEMAPRTIPKRKCLVCRERRFSRFRRTRIRKERRDSLFRVDVCALVNDGKFRWDDLFHADKISSWSSAWKYCGVQFGMLEMICCLQCHMIIEPEDIPDGLKKFDKLKWFNVSHVAVFHHDLFEWHCWDFKDIAENETDPRQERIIEFLLEN